VHSYHHTTITTQRSTTACRLIMPHPAPSRCRGNPIPSSLNGRSHYLSIDEPASSTNAGLTLTNKGGANQEAVLLLPVLMAWRCGRCSTTGWAEATAQFVARTSSAGVIGVSYHAIVIRCATPGARSIWRFNLIRRARFPIPAGLLRNLILTYEQVLNAGWDRVGIIPCRGRGVVRGGHGLDDQRRNIKSDGASLDGLSPSHEIDTPRSARITCG